MVSHAPGRYAMLRWAALLFAVLLAPSCAGQDSGQPLLTAEMPLHLEDHLDDATIIGSEVPAEPAAGVEWRFDEPQPDWKPVVTMNPNTEPAKVERTDDALRLTLDESNNNLAGLPVGGIAIELPEWSGRDWGSILVRARASEGIDSFSVGFNTRDVEPGTSVAPNPYALRSIGTDAVNDGGVNTYSLPPRPRGWGGTWNRLGLWVWASGPATFEVLSVSVIPTEADYADAAAGVSADILYDRRSIYSHAPGRLEYRVRVPEAGRLDLGLRVLRDDDPVTFDVTATPDGGETQTLLVETYDDPANWAQRSVDLSHLAGRTVTLGLGADAERAGAVALWASPTLSGVRRTDKPNVVLYIIDGAGAEYMSAYGYNRRTTPNLERLAAEGALFEHAYSNARWTKPSTPSFMTSLHHSVLGGFNSYSDPLPEQAVPMAEHFHRAGYQTALFTGNPLAGRQSSLDRGVDVIRDGGMYGVDGPSSVGLHREFWQWREALAGEPYWVHFQTIDVHGPGWFRQSPPFSGLYLSPGDRAEYSEWAEQVRLWGALERFEEAGIDRLEFYDRNQRLYSEAMAQQDHEIGMLVERLKSRGEWGNTLLVVAADHGEHESGLTQLEPFPPLGQHTHIRPEHTRIPMIFVWPGHIDGGQRFTDAVSMIDMLPTLLDLAELPPPEVMQGQSLAPLLLGEEGWEPRPVIFDEFYNDEESGEQRGWIEVIDGRWGASLAINPDIEFTWRRRGEYIAAQRGERPAPLLLYDLWNDPYCMNSVHEEHPDLVKKYTEFLEAQRQAHQMLATQFTEGAPAALTPEQLQALRALGYIQ